MATKTTPKDEIAEQVPVDPMKEYTTVRLPRATGKEEDTVLVGLNGKNYMIKRGVPVRIPKPVAAVLQESEYQRERQIRYEEAQQEKRFADGMKIWR